MVLRGLRRGVPAFIKGALRRQAANHLPSREAREYETWIAHRLRKRSLQYSHPLEPGLLSVLTPVWDGSPLRYLSILSDSIITQNTGGESEWVILDNGCKNSDVLAYLDGLAKYKWIKLLRSGANTGIISGLRTCLLNASGRYVLPVDADDYLYPDAFRVITSFITKANYPPLLYSDEDKVNGRRFYQPYLKPGWDPVLLLNSAYIAHLGVIDRQKAIELGAYTDPKTEGSPDWDLFLRFMLAGHSAAHIPEVLYSWRIHAHSTADDAKSKPYVHNSQRRVLESFLDATPQGAKFQVEYSPFLNGSAHWHIGRRQEGARPIATVTVDTKQCDLGEVRAVAAKMADNDGLVQFVGSDVAVENQDWFWEVLGLFELHPDAVMVGGRIVNKRGIVTEGGRYFGIGGVYGNPNHGRQDDDPGYFTQMWKQRSVSAVSTQLAVAEARFLLDVLSNIPVKASPPFLGAWAGAHAYRQNKRIVYSPFLSGVSDFDWLSALVPAEEKLFAELNHDLIPDTRFYSPALCSQKPFGLCTGKHN